MISLSAFLRTAVLCVLFVPTQGHAAELLRPVDQGVTDSFTSAEQFPLQYGLRVQLYTAKQYRIVEIDFDLLDRPDEEFTITPWPGLTVAVKAMDIATPGSYEGLRGWAGAIIPGGTAPVSVYESLPINFMVYERDHLMPVKQVRRILAESRRQAPLPYKEGRLRPPDDALIKLKFKTVMGRFYAPQTGASILIEPIEDDPRYHVVFEQDPSKVIWGDSMEKYQQRVQFDTQVAEERIRDLGR